VDAETSRPARQTSGHVDTDDALPTVDGYERFLASGLDPAAHLVLVLRTCLRCGLATDAEETRERSEPANRASIGPRWTRWCSVRHELFHTRTPPSKRAIAEIIDDVFLPLVEA
jgi:hypothetical protein